MARHMTAIEWLAGEGLAAERLEEGHILKSRAARIVVELPEHDLVAKRYRIGGWFKRLAVTIGRAKGRLEWDLLVEAARRGLPVARPVAYGVRRRGGLIAEEWLLTGRLAAASDLATIARACDLGRALPPGRKLPLIGDLARLVGEAHRAGLRHEDLHPGNIVRSAGRLFLIDLDGARFGGPLSDAERVDSLAILDRFFFLRAGRTDRLRFLVAYGRPDLARVVSARTVALAIPFWRRRVRRYTRGNRHIGALAAGRLRGWIDRRAEGLGFVDRLDDLDRWMATGQVFKDSRSAFVVRVADPVTGEALFVKRIAGRPSKVVASLFRPTKAIRAWRGSWRLVMRDLPTPPPVAVLEERRGPFVGRQYLITREVAPTAALDRVLGDVDRRDLAGALARALRRVTERGLVHGDLKPANILVHAPPDRPLEIHLIDLESLREGRAPDDGLGRLARSMATDRRVSRTDLLRFLKVYLGPFPPPPERWKAMWRAIASRMV